MLGATEALSVSHHAIPPSPKPLQHNFISENASYLDGFDSYGESSSVPNLPIQQALPRSGSSESSIPLANVTPRRSMMTLHGIGVLLSDKK